MKLPRALSGLLYRRRPGLQVRIAVLVVLGLLTLFIAFGVLAIVAVRQSTQAALQNQAALARLAAHHLDTRLGHFETMLRLGARSKAAALRSVGSEQRQSTLRELQEGMGDGVEAAFLADSDFRITLTAPEQDLIGFALALTPSARSDVRSGAAAIADFVGPRDVGESLIAIAVPVAAADDDGQGIVGVVLNLTNPAVTGGLDPGVIGDLGMIEVVDAAGKIVVTNDPYRLFGQADHGQYLRNLIDQRRSDVATCHDCHTQSPTEAPRRDVLAFAPLSHAPLGVSVRQPEDEVLAPTRALEGQVLILAGISIILAVSIALFTTRSILRPVRALTLASQRLAEGDLETRVPAMGDDEVGLLGRAFDMMRERLKTSMAEIRTWNRELDSRVQRRTEELEISRDELRRSRDYLQAIIDSLHDGLMVVDPEYRITHVNRALTRAYSGATTALKARDCHAIAVHSHDQCDGPGEACPVASVLKSGYPAHALFQHTDPRTGEIRHTDVVASPVLDGEGQVIEVVEVLRDVTEEKSLETEILHRNRELASMNAVAAVVSQSLKLEVMLNSALEKVLEVLGADMGVIHVRNVRTGNLDLAAFSGLPSEAADAIASLKGSDSLGTIGATYGPVYVEDVSRYRGSRRRELRDVGIHSLVQVPLKSKGVVLGGICVATRESRQFTPAEFDLLGSIAGQIAVAVENAQLYEEVRIKERIRGELLDKVITAQEEERKRIARELHDDTSQALVALVAAIEAATANPDLVEARKQFLRIKPLAARSLEEINKLIFDLRPTLLDDMGLVAAIGWYAETRLESAGVRIHLETNGTERRLRQQTETSLFRIVQEVINNIAKHADAESVSISLEFTASSLIIEIEDDGRGFDPASVEYRGEGVRGLGLLGMRERVGLLEGRLDIYSQPGEGARVVVEVPLELVGASYEQSPSAVG